jgi:hypothetical protein
MKIIDNGGFNEIVCETEKRMLLKPRKFLPSYFLIFTEALL